MRSPTAGVQVARSHCRIFEGRVLFKDEFHMVLQRDTCDGNGALGSSLAHSDSISLVSMLRVLEWAIADRATSRRLLVRIRPLISTHGTKVRLRVRYVQRVVKNRAVLHAV